MRRSSREHEDVKLFAMTLSCFTAISSAISFGIGVFEKDVTWLIGGCYSLALALLLLWLVSE